jgi:hypothetical protein
MARKRTKETVQATTGADVFDEQIAAKQAKEEGMGAHAAAVEKKQYPPVTDPFQLAHDNLAGARLLESRKRYEMLLAFEEKPTPEVLDKVKEHGFRWNNQEKLWTLKIGRDTANQDRMNGQRAYRAVADMIRAERGHEPTTEQGPAL